MAALHPRFHRLTVADVRQETADAVSVAFAVPADLAADYAFAPGQYLTLRRPDQAEDVRRSYSICSGPDDGELRVAIKKIDGGLFSTWAHAALKAGESIDVMTPTGRFGVAPAPAAARVHVGFAAGSGITPILSLIRGVLASEPQSRFFLFYGNRSMTDMLFREALEDVKDRFLGRFSLFHVLSREEQDLPILNGRLDTEKVGLVMRHLVPAASVDHAFVCGPADMSEAVAGALREAGVAAEKIHVERFVSALEGRPRPAPITTPAIDAAPRRTATLVVDGKRREVPVADGEAILDAALRAGMDLPYACKGGMCCTCRAKLVAGEARMLVNYSLETWEIEAGFILTCQAHPLSDHVSVDYDHV